MRTKVILMILFMAIHPLAALAAYHHGGDTDSDIALQAFPVVKGTKLDNCALCHTGGKYEKKPNVFIELGSCQWCHFSYGYDGSGNIEETLNDYGKDYNNGGRDLSALSDISQHDSDHDGFTNEKEISA